jgi:hypothetical protein
VGPAHGRAVARPAIACHRRFQLWQRSGRLDRLLQRLADDIRDRRSLSLETRSQCRENRALNSSFIALSTSTGSQSCSARPVQ